MSVQENPGFIESRDAAIEDLQEAIIRAGGCMFRKQRLLQMTLGEMMENFIPNNIVFKFYHDPDIEEYF